MFMNLTIRDTKRFTIRNIGSSIHDMIHDSTTMVLTYLALLKCLCWVEYVVNRLMKAFLVL